MPRKKKTEEVKVEEKTEISAEALEEKKKKLAEKAKELEGKVKIEKKRFLC
jgi:hypothetical protein